MSWTAIIRRIVRLFRRPRPFRDAPRPVSMRARHAFGVVWLRVEAPGWPGESLAMTPATARELSWQLAEASCQAEPIGLPLPATGKPIPNPSAN
jgi:hypothetical protein